MSLVQQLLKETSVGRNGAAESVRTHLHIALGYAHEVGDAELIQDLDAALTRLEARSAAVASPQGPSNS